jgi:hypothetical protein
VLVESMGGLRLNAECSGDGREFKVVDGQGTRGIVGCD